MSAQLANAGLKVIFTGHYHSQALGGPVSLFQAVHGFFEERFHLSPVDRGIHGGYFYGEALPGLSARFTANDVHRRPACDLVKPGRKNRARFEVRGIAREIGKNRL